MSTHRHTIVAELMRAELDVQHGLATLTLHLRQPAAGYTHQRLNALRSYPGGIGSAQRASAHYAALQIGRTYAITAEALSSAAGAVYLLGVTDIALVMPEPIPYPEATAPASLMTAGQVLAMSLPAAARGAA